MLKISSKKYEIEEEVEGYNEATDQTYKFIMQITHDDLKELEKCFFNVEAAKLYNQIKKIDKENNEELLNQKFEELMAMLLSGVEKITAIAMKEHKLKLKEVCGEVVFEKATDEIVSFFLNVFSRKVSPQKNTIPIDLMKIMKK